MQFFNTELAATLQYFTFPLEVVGLSLAVIEIRFPAHARRIELIISSYSRFHSVRNEAQQQNEQRAGVAESVPHATLEECVDHALSPRSVGALLYRYIVPLILVLLYRVMDPNRLCFSRQYAELSP